MTVTFMLLTKEGGKIINISSTAGILEYFSNPPRKRVLKNSTIAEVENLQHQFLNETDSTSASGARLLDFFPLITWFSEAYLAPLQKVMPKRVCDTR